MSHRTRRRKLKSDLSCRVTRYVEIGKTTLFKEVLLCVVMFLERFKKHLKFSLIILIAPMCVFEHNTLY
jgi:hypothetical protein